MKEKEEVCVIIILFSFLKEFYNIFKSLWYWYVKFKEIKVIKKMCGENFLYWLEDKCCG